MLDALTLGSKSAAPVEPVLPRGRAPDALGEGPAASGRDLDLRPFFHRYEVAAYLLLSLCAHLFDFLRLHCLHSI